MKTNQHKRHTVGKTVFDRNFPPNIYQPVGEIIYNDEYNAKILEVINVYRIQYAKVFKSGKTAVHDDFKYLYEYLMDCTKHMPEDKFKISFRIFWVLNKWQDFPKCTVCGRRLILDNENLGFRLRLDFNGNLVYNWPRTCCPEHAQRDDTARQNYIQTCIDKYGCENTFQVPEFKEKSVAKYEARYGKGITSPAKSPEVRAQMQATCLKNYGVTNPFQSKEIRDRTMQAYKDKTGYDSPQKNPETWLKSNERQLAERGYTHIQMRNKAPGYGKNILGSEYDEPLFSLEDFVRADNHTVPMRFKCKKCGNEFEAIHVRTHNRCPVCYPSDWIDKPPSYLSSLNRRLFQILDDAGIQYENEFAIDFDIQDSEHTYRRYDVKIGNVIIEANGDYWHANRGFLYNGRPIQSDTVLNFVGGMTKTAQEIWDYDEEKRKLAESHGFKVYYLWEHEINSMSDSEILQWIKEKIEYFTEKI